MICGTGGSGTVLIFQFALTKKKVVFFLPKKRRVKRLNLNIMMALTCMAVINYQNNHEDTNFLLSLLPKKKNIVKIYKSYIEFIKFYYTNKTNHCVVD